MPPRSKRGWVRSPQRGDEPLDSGRWIGEHVDVLQLCRYLTGQTAIIEPERDNERFLERPFLGPIERIAKFGVKPPRSFDSPAGEAGYEVVGDADSPVDGPGPVLAGKEFFAVHPGMKASFFEKFVKCFDSDYVLDGIGEENSFAACGEEANVALGIGSEGTD